LDVLEKEALLFQGDVRAVVGMLPTDSLEVLAKNLWANPFGRFTARML
jgi:hypothetical protein